MVDQNIVDYLSEGLRRGHHVDSLRHALLEAGHDSSDVDDAIGIASQKSEFDEEPVNVESKVEKSSKKSKKLWFLVGAFVLVVILIGAYFVFRSSSDLDSTVPLEDSE